MTDWFRVGGSTDLNASCVTSNKKPVSRKNNANLFNNKSMLYYKRIRYTFLGIVSNYFGIVLY